MFFFIIAFMDTGRPTKNQLNPTIISDIIECVVKRCNVTEAVVRSSITTKCADENKMLRQRESRAARGVLRPVENTKREIAIRPQGNKEN